MALLLSSGGPKVLGRLFLDILLKGAARDATLGINHLKMLHEPRNEWGFVCEVACWSFAIPFIVCSMRSRRTGRITVHK